MPIREKPRSARNWQCNFEAAVYRLLRSFRIDHVALVNFIGISPVYNESDRFRADERAVIVALRIESVIARETQLFC